MTKIKTQKMNDALDANVVRMRPKRKRISTEQLNFLTNLFEQTTSPNHALREKLTKQLDMTNREIQVWFQNRRAKVNRIGSQQKQQKQTLEKPKRVDNSPKFYYWHHESSFSASSSVSLSPPQTPYEIVFQPGSTPIDILATAAVYVQRWEEEQRQWQKEEHWRPWN